MSKHTDLAEQSHWRRIKSFVKREGRLSSRQKEALTAHWWQFGLCQAEGLLDFGQLRPAYKAIILEIGFGMGDSLIEMARQSPDCLFIGVEVHRPGVGNLLYLANEYGLKNLRVFCDDAVEVLRACIPNNGLDKLQIFFPDPWPKQRHHKRRLIQQAFIEQLTPKLKPQGVLHLATDWQDYAKHMQKVMQQTSSFSPIKAESRLEAPWLKRPQTKYERRGQSLGHEIYDGWFERV